MPPFYCLHAIKICTGSQKLYLGLGLYGNLPYTFEISNPFRVQFKIIHRSRTSVKHVGLCPRRVGERV